MAPQPHVFFLHICMIFVLLLVPIQLWFLPEYHANFAIETAGLPKTATALGSSKQHKLGIVLKYPYMHFVASDLNDENDHNLASIRHARGGSVVGELTFNVNDFYDIAPREKKEDRTGTSVAKMCTQVKDFTFEWSNYWHLFVPGCAKGTLSTTLTDDGDWNLKTLDDPDNVDVAKCYISARRYTRNALGQKIVWGISVLVYALMLKFRDAKMRMGCMIMMLIVFLVFMICQGLQYNFLHEVDKKGCFADRIAKVMETVDVVDTPGGSTSRAVKAYDWHDNLHKYVEGDSFADTETDEPSITEHDDLKIGTFTPNGAILWTNIGLSILGAILIIFDFTNPPSTAKPFTKSILM